ncbi:MAG: CHAP domain-containing protein [Spirochaetia bacterium]|nr:CHAP domain-containing protein [Spirochaetia bacterium]
MRRKIKIIISFLLFLNVAGELAAKKRDRGDMVKKEPDTEYLDEKDKIRLKIRKVSQSLIGNNRRTIKLNGKTYPNDCSGMVRAVFDSIGVNVYKKADTAPRGANGVRIIHHSFKDRTWDDAKKRMPRTGDLIIFNNTYDMNKNKKWDDKYTHVSVVTGVEKNGTIAFIHHVSQGIQRYRMNLFKNTVYKEGDVKYNDFIRRRPKSDKNKEKYLSSSAFYTFIDVLGGEKVSYTDTEVYDKDENNSENKKINLQIKEDIQKLLVKYGISEDDLVEYLQSQ